MKQQGQDENLAKGRTLDHTNPKDLIMSFEEVFSTGKDDRLKVYQEMELVGNSGACELDVVLSYTELKGLEGTCRTYDQYPLIEE